MLILCDNSLGEYMTEKPVMINLPTVNPNYIKQNLVSDCSFVCSLCIAASFELCFGKRLVSSIIFPQNAGQPVYNAYGKYLVKLFVNGVVRKVIVDDRLPHFVSENGNNNLACSYAVNGELWVSIIEKVIIIDFHIILFFF